MRRIKWLAIAAVALLAACTGDWRDPLYGRPREPRFSEMTLTPVATDLARLYFYRDWEPYESNGRPWIYLNGERAGISQPGAVYYRDLPAGEYRITVNGPAPIPTSSRPSCSSPARRAM